MVVALFVVSAFLLSSSFVGNDGMIADDSSGGPKVMLCCCIAMLWTWRKLMVIRIIVRAVSRATPPKTKRASRLYLYFLFALFIWRRGARR